MNEMKSRGDLLNSSCAIEYFLRKMRFLEYKYERLRGIQDVITKKNATEISRLRSVLLQDSLKSNS